MIFLNQRIRYNLFDIQIFFLIILVRTINVIRNFFWHNLYVAFLCYSKGILAPTFFMWYFNIGIKNINLYEDDKNTISHSKDKDNNRKIKHNVIDLLMTKFNVLTFYVESSSQITDILTKCLRGQKNRFYLFFRQRDMLCKNIFKISMWVCNYRFV